MRLVLEFVFLIPFVKTSVVGISPSNPQRDPICKVKLVETYLIFFPCMMSA